MIGWMNSLTGMDEKNRGWLDDWMVKKMNIERPTSNVEGQINSHAKAQRRKGEFGQR
jgi:hypothetical protein